MQLGVNVPNFGPGTDPGVLREWAQVVEGLGFGLLMMSDHVVVTPEVAERYPEPFYEPFTTLAWLAGVTSTVRLGTTVLILPYREPLLVARTAGTLNRLSGGRPGAGGRRRLVTTGVRGARRAVLRARQADRRAPGRPAEGLGRGDRRRRRLDPGLGRRPQRGRRPAHHQVRRRLASAAGQPPGHALRPRTALAAGVRAPHRPAAHRRADRRPRAARRRRVPSSRSSTIWTSCAGSAPKPSCSTPTTGTRRTPMRPHAAWQALATVANHWRTAS